MDHFWPFLLAGGIVFLSALIVFLVVGLQPLMRAIIKSTGTPARARILEKRIGKWVMTDGNEYSRNVTRQQITLKLEVHPQDAISFITEDKFMAKPEELMKLNPGCDVQVVIARDNPERVVCLPETVSAPIDAPAQARAGVAMADIVEQALQGTIPSTDAVLDALKSQGFQTSFTTTSTANLTPDQQKRVEDVLQRLGTNPGMVQILKAQGTKTNVFTSTGDPKDTLQKLKDLLESGLITQQEYDQKKKDILDRM